MVPAEYAGFFVSSVGAAAALIGLLFVAVSIAPERIVTRAAPPRARASALSAFTGLTNAFFISLFAQIPHLDQSLPVVITGGIALVSTLVTGYTLLTGPGSEESRVSNLIFTLANGALYVSELFLVALPLWLRPNVATPFFALSFLLIGISSTALARAWTLIAGGSPA
jgi:hypothetical protein